MSNYIPFEIQSQIIKNLPVISLLQFRCVSKQWKALIDSSEFIKNYHINRTNHQHHLLVERKLSDNVRTYILIIDDNTFPQQKFLLTAPAPEPLNILKFASIIGSVDGLLVFYGFYLGFQNKMVVIWNPSVRKYIGIVISNALSDVDDIYACIGFGVCPDTNDPRLVKIDVVHSRWVVEVFMLSTRVWKTVYAGTQFKSCKFTSFHVSIDGIIYWRNVRLNGRLGSNYIISFDLKREKFGEVFLSERLARAHDLVMGKANESLCLLENYNEGEMSVCGVWMMKDGVNKPFTKMYTVKVEGRFNSVLGYWKYVLGFRKNGEVVLEMEDDNNDILVKVYEPSSGCINGIGINNEYVGFSAVSYMESLLLLHESNSIIH